MKRILVTGASGFIGREVVHELTVEGYSVTAGLRSISAAAQEKGLLLDLSRPQDLLQLAEQDRFDAIVHLGALVEWRGDIKKEMYVTNVLSTGCLALLASCWGAHLVFASTVTICGIKTSLIDENSAVLRDSIYAQSKWLGEQLLESSTVPHCNLRIAGVFGLDGPQHLGLNRTISAAIDGVIPVQVGAGLAKRNYIYVKDVARAVTFSVMENLHGTHLLAGKDVLSIHEMLSAVCDIFLPNHQPHVNEGPEATDQIVESSSALPIGRSFHDALADIKRNSH